MKLKHLLILGAGAAIGYNIIFSRTEIDTRYDGPISIGKVKVENIDRHPFYRKDDRRLTIHLNDYRDTQVEFYNHDGWTGFFMDHKEDKVEERHLENGQLVVKRYTQDSYNEGIDHKFAKDSQEYLDSRERLKELTDLYWKATFEAADSIMVNHPEFGKAHRKRLERKLRSKNN